MPRPNPGRSLAREAALGRRIAHEREVRRWSYEGLASRLKEVDCPIQATAIYKIEKSDPPRRITVTELIGFSDVFGVPVQELLLPLEVVVDLEGARLVADWDAAAVALGTAGQRYNEAWGALRTWSEDNPDHGASVLKAIKKLAPSRARDSGMTYTSAVDWMQAGAETVLADGGDGRVS